MRARELIELLAQFESDTRVVVGENKLPYKNISKIEEVNITHSLGLRVIGTHEYKDIIEVEETAIQLSVIMS